MSTVYVLGLSAHTSANGSWKGLAKLINLPRVVAPEAWPTVGAQRHRPLLPTPS